MIPCRCPIPLARHIIIVVAHSFCSTFCSALHLLSLSYHSRRSPQNIALLVGKDGAAKVKSISVEDPYTSASAKLTGANFKFTALKLSEAFADGEKVETEITFGDKGTLTLHS